MNEKIAKALCDADVLKLGLFTLASGIQSPVYVDLRILPSFPESFRIVTDELAKLVKKLNVEIVAGAETAGIPYAAAIALKTDLPMVYVRKMPKKYGTGSMVEGLIKEGNRCVLIDDMITNGGSKFRFIDGIRNAGGVIEDVVVTLDREQGGQETLEKEGVKLHSLITLRELISYMLENNMITGEEHDNIIDYLENAQDNI